MELSQLRTITGALVGLLLALAIIAGVTGIQQVVFHSISTTSFGSNTSRIGSSASTSASTSRPSSGGVGQLGIAITDQTSAPAGVTAMYTTFSLIQAHLQGASIGSDWYTIASNTVLNVLSFRSASVTLGSSTVTTGVFDLARFDIAATVVTYDGQNYSAPLSSNQVMLPIAQGGVAVYPGQSSGLLVDFSPIVVGNETTGGGVGFSTVPSGAGLPIPSQDWTNESSEVGTVTTNDWWSSVPVSMGNLSVQSIGLTPSSFALVAMNVGNVSVTLDGFSISQTNSSSGNVTSTTTSTTTVTNSTTTFTGNTTTIISSTTVTNSTNPGVPQAVTIATFDVLANGTVTMLSGNATLPSQIQVGYVIPPGQAAAFVFNGTISSLPGPDGVSLRIIPNEIYDFQILGQDGFMMAVDTNATLT